MPVETKITVEQAMQQCFELYNTSNFEKALDIAASIINEYPEHIDSKYIASLCYVELGKYAHAEKLLSICYQAVPNSIEVIFNLGIVYSHQGRKKDAINAYNAVLSLDSNHIGALNNIGNIYNESGNNALALQHFEKILSIKGDLYYVYNNIALIYKRLGMLKEALSYVLKSIELSPDGVEQNHNAALICASMARNKDSIAFYKKAYNMSQNNLQLVMEYHDALGKVCDWEARKNLDPVIDKLMAEQKPDEINPMMTDIQKNKDPAYYLKIVREFSKKAVDSITKVHNVFQHDISQESNDKKKKLRIGYMSSDIKDHPVSHLMRGVFKNHNKDGFEIYVYSFSKPDNSNYKEEIASYCDKFYDISNVSNLDTAKLIYNDKIDILIDLNGHTGTPRLEALALKPAPIQVNYIGYIGSMGADFIDYVIVDEIVAPPEDQEFYDEKFVYLPDCYQANDNDLIISDENITKKSEGLPEDKFIFCCLNQTYKIEPVMFETWMNILKRTPNSVLWLYKGSIYEDDNLAVENLRKEAKKYGVEQDRIIFAKAVAPIAKHLKRTALADIALDTRLYNGGTVTSQTLWAGVPVITLKGKCFTSRMATSILNAVGMPELITTSLKEYEDLAVEVATDPNRTSKLKEKLQENKKTKPLFDTQLFTKNLEKAYRKMWENYCDGNKAKFIDLKKES